MAICGCEVLFDSKVCTSEFRMIGVSVVYEDKEPVIFDDASVKNHRTGNEIDLCSSYHSNCTREEIIGHPESGYYTIYHDGLRNEIGMRPVALMFSASNDSVSVEQLFLIDEDGCHVQKKAGPDQIIINKQD